MKTVFCAVNAKFIHSSPALRSIKAYCGDVCRDTVIAEFTINNDIDYIINELYLLKPDMIAFSCYIWNMGIILDIVRTIRKIIPDIKIAVGGPEVSYEYEYLFEKGIDIVTVGEGEAIWKELLPALENGGDISGVKGIAYKEDENVIYTGRGEIVPLDYIPFFYEGILDEFENKIIYYEASRGCPYRCQYCLSSADEGVRFLSRERVFSDLKYFLDNDVKQVKFVDRTFNCNKKFASDIWNFLIDNDNGVTNFHFEISADILDEEEIKILSRARKRLFQLEIGVQSTNARTLERIKRTTDNEKVFDTVRRIQKFGNIHQHLDLIAGLPNEDIMSFKKSFDDVFSLRPEQLQLGFLKLLKGSGLRRDAKELGIVYKDTPPYEVLYTKEIPYMSMMRLKRVEELLEMYYNSGKAVNTIFTAAAFFDGAFDFFEKFSYFWEEKGYHRIMHSKMSLYTALYEFLKERVKIPVSDMIKFDIFANDNIKTFPQWLESDNGEEMKMTRRRFFNDEENIRKYMNTLSAYSPVQLSRMCHLEKFSFDVEKWLESGHKEINMNDSYVLFNYYEKNDINLNGNITYTVIEKKE
ncbi:MAG: B12-binding domain-containing radical SAM protein [Firmicutes bacterium]|nr:B12-binding domain-containing radical SAM protein [Bacillota bacterium]